MRTQHMADWCYASLSCTVPELAGIFKEGENVTLPLRADILLQDIRLILRQVLHGKSACVSLFLLGSYCFNLVGILTGVNCFPVRNIYCRYFNKALSNVIK